MNYEYELVVVIQGDSSEENKNKIIEGIKKTIEAEKGEIIDVKEWGKRELAYEIKKNKEGFYTLFTFKGNSNLPNHLSSKFKLMEEILRYLIVRKENRKFKVEDEN